MRVERFIQEMMHEKGFQSQLQDKDSTDKIANRIAQAAREQGYLFSATSIREALKNRRKHEQELNEEDLNIVVGGVVSKDRFCQPL